MKAIEIRNKYLKFFEKHNHKIIPSAPLIPENDSSVLFNTAGMQPLVPYLLGEKHPEGTRLADYQNVLEQTTLMKLVITDTVHILKCLEIGHLEIILKRNQLLCHLNY